jgi:hypothetical protein
LEGGGGEKFWKENLTQNIFNRYVYECKTWFDLKSGLGWGGQKIVSTISAPNKDEITVVVWTLIHL